VGCQKPACPVSCSDGPGPALGHDDHPCPCACPTSSSSGSAAGWSCSAVQRPPKTPSCSCRGTRSPRCAAQSPAPARLGRPRNPRRTHPASASKAADARLVTPGTVLRWHPSLCIHAAYRAPAPAGPTAAGSKVGLGVMPIGSVTPSDGHGPGERSPTRLMLGMRLVGHDREHNAEESICDA
jgi:hypothetical protein